MWPNPAGSADIGVVRVTDSLNTQVGSLTLHDLQSDTSGTITISNTGSNGGRAQDVSITSQLANPLVFSGMRTQTSTLELSGANPVSLVEGDISGNLYLSAAAASFLFNGNDFRREPADVVLLLPTEELLNFYVDGSSYRTNTAVFFSANGLEGDNANGGSLLDNIDHISGQSMAEVETILEDSVIDWRTAGDTDTSRVLRGIGIEIDERELIDYDAEEIRNDFLRTIEVDRNSNSFSYGSSPDDEEDSLTENK